VDDVYMIKQCLGILIGTGNHQHPCRQCVTRISPILLAHGNKISPRNSLGHRSNSQAGFPEDSLDVTSLFWWIGGLNIAKARYSVSWCQFQKKVLQVFKLQELLYPSSLHRSSHCILCIYEEVQDFVKNDIGINTLSTYKVVQHKEKLLTSSLKQW